jgi:hypothetical protein
MSLEFHQARTFIVVADAGIGGRTSINKKKKLMWLDQQAGFHDIYCASQTSLIFHNLSFFNLSGCLPN